MVAPEEVMPVAATLEITGAAAADVVKVASVDEEVPFASPLTTW